MLSTPDTIGSSSQRGQADASLVSNRQASASSTRSAGGTAVLLNEVAPKSPRRVSNQGRVLFRDLATSGSDVDMGCGRPETTEMEDCGWQ